MYAIPPIETIIEGVKKYDKRVGLRKLYQDFDIPEPERYKFRKLWNMFYDILPDAFEKELTENASEIRETEEDDGHRGASPGETLQAEPESPEDV